MVCVEDVGSGFPCNPWGLHIKFLCHTFQSDLYTVRGLKPEYVADGSRKRYKWNWELQIDRDSLRNLQHNETRLEFDHSTLVLNYTCVCAGVSVFTLMMSTHMRARVLFDYWLRAMMRNSIQMYNEKTINFLSRYRLRTGNTGWDLASQDLVSLTFCRSFSTTCSCFVADLCECAASCSGCSSRIQKFEQVLQLNLSMCIFTTSVCWNVHLHTQLFVHIRSVCADGC